MKKNNLFKRIIALASAVVLAAGLSGVTASAAPDPTKIGSITVHKFGTMGASTTNHDGTELQDTTSLGTKLPGATFSLHKVNAGVDLVSTDDADALVAAGKTTLISQEITDANGEIQWGNLTAAYYVLVEDAAPAGYTKSASSIITFPYGYNPDPANSNATTDYNYEIHVYPKNINDSPVTKVVKNAQKAYVVGDLVNWEIGSKIDIAKKLYDIAATPTHGLVKITDELDERLTYDPLQSAQKAVLTLTGGSGSVVLSAGDFTETITVAPVTGAQTIVWELTNAGLELAQSKGSTGITVDFKTSVNAKAQNSGTAAIENDATVNITYIDGSTTEEKPTVKPEIKLGGVIINKTNRDETVKLANAKFKLALTKADAKNGVFLKDAANKDIEVTTDGNGYAQFVDFTKVTPTIDWDNAQTFYLVETQAPAGYILKQAAVEVITTDDGTLIGTPQKQTTVTVLNQGKDEPPIPKDENPTFQLPLTGGAGTALFTAVGLLLMTGATVVLVRNRKKSA